MIKYLVRTAIVLAIALAVVIVGYNYFWGDSEEQQQSRKIVAQVKNLTDSVVDLLKSEKEKYDQGKYDDALSKLKTTITVLKEQATAMGEKGEQITARIAELENQEEQLRSKLTALSEEEADQAGGNLMMSSPGADLGAPISHVEPQQAAESIRQEILRLNREAADLSVQLSQL